MTDPKKAKQIADVLAGFAEPTRLRIVDALRAGSKNVTELGKLLGVEIVNVSHHLGVLKQAGLVQDQKVGRHVVYSLPPAVFQEDGDGAVVDLGWCRVEIPND